MRVVAVLDGATGAAERRARALGGFLSGGMTGAFCGETLVFYHDQCDRDGLVELAPTRDVRLVRVPVQRPDRLVESLSAAAQGTDAGLVLFPGDGGGAELAARLAARNGGAILTQALSIEIAPDRLVCRRNVYSAHMLGRFDLSGRLSCVTIDASWDDAGWEPPAEHRVVADTDESAGAGDAAFDDVELLEPPATSDLAESRFLVVAGNGVGTREGVKRVERAARRMGADFGITRPVAMSALAPLDRLIGVSGARSAPALCIAAGAYGAPAFFWGIERAGFIVAINDDEAAPIAGNADAVVMDDAVSVVEELAEIVAAARRRG